ncbi:3627_t:CDS:2, partial [Funneliformis geosporum]
MIPILIDIKKRFHPTTSRGILAARKIIFDNDEVSFDEEIAIEDDEQPPPVNATRKIRISEPYLREDSKSEGLELNNDFFTKLKKKEITGSSFLKLTGWDFKGYGITLEQALKLEDYIKELGVREAKIGLGDDVTFGNAYVSETVVVASQLVIADTPQKEIPTVDSKVTHNIKAVNRYPENSYEDAYQMSLEISEEFEKTVPSGNDQSHVTSVKPDLEVSMEQDDEQKSLDKNQIIEQGLIQELCGTLPLAPSADTCSPISSDDNTSSTNTNSSCNGSENMIS